MELINRLIRRFTDLVARFKAALDHTHAWRQSNLEPRSKWDGKIDLDLKRKISE